MASLLTAAETATSSGLVRGLERAAAAGQTSTAETVLGVLAARFPRAAADAAARGLSRAVHSRQWATAAYFADFLADGEKRRAEGGGGTREARRRPPTRADTEREVLRCLSGDTSRCLSGDTSRAAGDASRAAGDTPRAAGAGEEETIFGVPVVPCQARDEN